MQSINRDRLDLFKRFVNAREDVRVRKERGDPAPWTKDPILSKYRFCNIRRNDDRQTRLIHQHWLSKRDCPDMWFAMCVARLVNWWPTLERMKFPGFDWAPKDFIRAVEAEKAYAGKAYTGAYMVRADAHPGGKAAYHAEKVLLPLWGDREHYRPRKNDTLDSFHVRLMGAKDFGSFLAAQVVADLKYYRGGNRTLSGAKDWDTWAASGPGSRRGLSRLCGAPPETPWTEPEWRARFSDLLRHVSGDLMAGFDLTGQDLQNCLCEFDKYERVRNGEGRPRSFYVPSHAKDNT